jgi:hypothetical protein
VYVSFDSYASYILYRIADRQLEAEHAQLVHLAKGHARPIRARIADWLVAIASRIDSRPYGQFASRLLLCA